MQAVNQQAEAVAGRVDPVQFGMGPLTILGIITQVLPLVIACWNRNDEPNPSLSAANFRRYYKSKPEQCLRRTARRVRADATQPMTKEQSFMLAQAIIDQALELDQDTVAACCTQVNREASR